MSQKILITLFFIFFVIPQAHSQQALQMIFVYPGGEGSNQDAEPYLNDLFATIKEESGLEFSGSYYSETDEALDAIKKLKPEVGIVSLDFYLGNHSSIFMELFLSTHSETSNPGTEQYAILCHQDQPLLKTSDLFYSKPFSEKFLKNNLLEDLISKGKTDFHFEETASIVMVLKKVAQGQLQACVLLDSYETAAFKKLEMDWTKKIKIDYQPNPLPSSPVVLFTKIPETIKQKLENTLLNLAKSSRGKKVLQNLRLKGFVKPDVKNYEETLLHFSKASLAAPKTPASSPK